MTLFRTIVMTVLTAGLGGCLDQQDVAGDTQGVAGVQTAADSSNNPSLSSVRDATEKYRDFKDAIEDGYQLGYHGAAVGCVASPTAGAMGYHYFKWSRMDDPTIKANAPEVLVYYTGSHGELELGAVEWVVPKVAWEAAGNTAPPVVLGQTLHILNPVLNWYVEHAWVWKTNPAGVFVDFNPSVSCP